MQGKTILVADDEPHITHVLSLKLRQRGAEVLVATDGRESLDLATEHMPDMVITDFQMPQMSGLEMATALKAQPATTAIPVVMLTARGHKISREELAATNIRKLLAKPFSARNLLDEIEAVMAGQTQNDTSTTDA